LASVNDTTKFWLCCFNETDRTYEILNYGISNLSNIKIKHRFKPIWYQTHLIMNYLILNQSDTEPNWYWTSLIPNNEPIRYRVYQIPNLSDTEPIRYRTLQIPSSVYCSC
jgi:hypothetical protein